MDVLAPRQRHQHTLPPSCLPPTSSPPTQPPPALRCAPSVPSFPPCGAPYSTAQAASPPPAHGSVTAAPSQPSCRDTGQARQPPPPQPPPPPLQPLLRAGPASVLLKSPYRGCLERSQLLLLLLPRLPLSPLWQRSSRSLTIGSRHCAWAPGPWRATWCAQKGHVACMLA